MDTRSPFTAIGACRSCGSASLDPILDLGVTPLADRLIAESMLDAPEPSCPLNVVFCGDCSLLQIRETVAPEILFSADYPYFSSVSPSLMAHFRESAEEVMQRRRSLDNDSLVLELASNDGYQLKHYANRGIPVLGIDPAPGPAAVAIEQGIDTRVAFFTRELAEELAAEGVAADVIHANNVLAHVADTNGFVSGIATLLKIDGEVIIECPYVRDLVDHCEFDTIYHQHLCYFSVTSLVKLFERHGLYVNRIVRTPVHGGSLRVHAGKVRDPENSVSRLLDEERELGIDQDGYFSDFSSRVIALRTSLRRLLDDIKQDSSVRIVGYGAAAKACTLMSYVSIDAEDIDYIVDRNPHKQGLYFSGNHLLIRPVEALQEDPPDYVLIMSWNFADEIIEQLSDYQSGGGRFIVPIPQPRVL